MLCFVTLLDYRVVCVDMQYFRRSMRGLAVVGRCSDEVMKLGYSAKAGGEVMHLLRMDILLSKQPEASFSG